MILLRKVRATDLDAVFHLAKQSGGSLSTLPVDKKLLQKRIDLACHSFAKSCNHPKDEYYLFVLEDVAKNKVIGTSGIEALTGHDAPYYTYHISRYSRLSRALKIQSNYEILTLVNDYQGCSEVCTLFLVPAYRQKYNGLILSKSRFLFMAQNPHRFAGRVVSEIHGVVDENNTSPFWEHVGRHFFHMAFTKADRLQIASNKQFIEDLMPQYPLYVPLLAHEAQAVLGKPTKTSIRAMQILLSEGFVYRGYVHIFDAGPLVEAPFKEIKTIALSQEYVLAGISDDVQGQQYFICNTSEDFRATSCNALIQEDSKTCIISKQTAILIQVQINDTVRLAPM